MNRDADSVGVFLGLSFQRADTFAARRGVGYSRTRGDDMGTSDGQLMLWKGRRSYWKSV